MSSSSPSLFDATSLRKDLSGSPLCGSEETHSLSSTPAFMSPGSDRVSSVFTGALSTLTVSDPLPSASPEFILRLAHEASLIDFQVRIVAASAAISAPMPLRRSAEEALGAALMPVCFSDDSEPHEIYIKRKAAQEKFLIARERLAEFIASDSCPDVFKGIKKERLFALFIDGDRLPADGFGVDVTLATQLTFDRKEPCYTSSMMGAFIFLFSSGAPLSVDFIEELHDLALDNVVSISASKEMELLERGLRSHHRKDHFESFGLKWDETVTEAGFKEIKAKLKDPRYLFNFGDNEEHALDLFIVNPNKTIKDDKASIQSRPPRVEGIMKAALGRLIELYQSAPKDTEDQKLEAIFRFLQDLEQIHPFYDGNIRTFMILLLQKLLVEQGLEPACFKDPNCLDCLSIAELKTKYLEAKELFRSFKAD